MCLFSLLVNDPTVDWTVRHGHAIALSAVLHDAVERIVSQGLYQAVTDAAVTHATTDRVSGYLRVVVVGVVLGEMGFREHFRRQLSVGL